MIEQITDNFDTDMKEAIVLASKHSSIVSNSRPLYPSDILATILENSFFNMRLIGYIFDYLKIDKNKLSVSVRCSKITSNADQAKSATYSNELLEIFTIMEEERVRRNLKIVGPEYFLLAVTKNCKTPVGTLLLKFHINYPRTEISIKKTKRMIVIRRSVLDLVDSKTDQMIQVRTYPEVAKMIRKYRLSNNLKKNEIINLILIKAIKELRINENWLFE